MTISKRLEVLNRTRKTVDTEGHLPFKTMYNKCNHLLNSIFQKCGNLCMMIDTSSTYNPPSTIYKNRKAMKAILSAKRRKFADKGRQETLGTTGAKLFHFTEFICDQTLPYIYAYLTVCPHITHTPAGLTINHNSPSGEPHIMHTPSGSNVEYNPPYHPNNFSSSFTTHIIRDLFTTPTPPSHII